MLRPGGVLLRRAAGAAMAVAGLLLSAPAAAALRVNGSTTVNPVVSEAAAVLRRELGLEIQVDTAGGSSGGIAALADGRADVAMVSRPLTASDRERFPGVDFRVVRIGSDALALVVSRDVWEGGVRCLDREQVRKLYQGEVRNWRQLGGPDQRVVFFNKEPGRGTWEVFATWLYGDADAAPLVSLPEVGSNEEGRSKVAATRGAVTQLSAAWADGERTVAMPICTAQGAVGATAESLESGAYPLARPLFVITNGAPSEAARQLIDFVLGPRGQLLVARHGYSPLVQDAAARGARP